MSWYAWIYGEIETPLDAKPKVQEFFGPWMDPEAEGRVELAEEKQKGLLRLTFQEVYRNLGRHIQGGLYELAHKYPEQTRGEAHIFSTDGEYYHAALRVDGGKVYERTLDPVEHELHRYSFRLGGRTQILYLTREAINERERRDELRRRDGQEKPK